MAHPMTAAHLRAFVARYLHSAPHERPSWATYCKEHRDRALRSAAVAAATLAAAGCGGDTESTGPDEGTGGSASAATGGDAAGGWDTAGREALGGLYGMPYETGGNEASGGTGGERVEDTGGTGGLWSGGTGGLGLGGMLYGIGGLVESGGTGGGGGLGAAYGIPYEYGCWDGYDNDYDDLVDCLDPDCFEECEGWLGCDAAGSVCTELVLDTYLTANPDCQRAESSCSLLYPCGSNCPVPSPSQAVPPSGTEWAGCTEDGLAVCGELVHDAYFDARPQCEEATCGDGPYYPCAPMCSERGVDEYPAGSSDNWDGCRGSGIWVCTELANSTYFENHPACIPNDTCAGGFYACNAICPPPAASELP